MLANQTVGISRVTPPTRDGEGGRERAREGERTGAFTVYSSPRLLSLRCSTADPAYHFSTPVLSTITEVALRSDPFLRPVTSDNIAQTCIRAWTSVFRGLFANHVFASYNLPSRSRANARNTVLFQICDITSDLKEIVLYNEKRKANPFLYDTNYREILRSTGNGRFPSLSILRSPVDQYIRIGRKYARWSASR